MAVGTEKKDAIYITKEDDTLNVVSKVFGVSENDLVKQNKTIYLLPGQMIFYKE